MSTGETPWPCLPNQRSTVTRSFPARSNSSPASGQAKFNHDQVNRWETEIVGVCVLHKGDASEIYHTYSTYARGVEMLDSAYHDQGLAHKGRDEASQGSNPQAWARRRDEYQDQAQGEHYSGGNDGEN